MGVQELRAEGLWGLGEVEGDGRLRFVKKYKICERLR